MKTSDFKLNLTRPLCVFDLETTGLRIGIDRIVEIGILKAFPDGHVEEFNRRVNPEMPIPPESSSVHHIYDADVALEPTFKALAPKIVQFIGNSDLAGFNSNKFDVPVLVEEFLRVGVDFDMKNRRTIDVQNIYHKMEPRTLAAAVKLYLDEEMKDAHAALADTRATFEVLKAQIVRYQDAAFVNKDGSVSHPVKNDMAALAEFSTQNKSADLAGFIVYDKDGAEVFGFGKHKGKKVEEVFHCEPSYYDWVQKADFPLYTKKVLTEIRLRSFKS